jgi:hypothetical protein
MNLENGELLEFNIFSLKLMKVHANTLNLTSELGK